jgi:archaellum component FlaD/FlaE
MGKGECASAEGKYIKKCLRYYERLGWVNREDSKKAMKYIGNDQ